MEILNANSSHFAFQSFYSQQVFDSIESTCCELKLKQTCRMCKTNKPPPVFLLHSSSCDVSQRSYSCSRYNFLFACRVGGCCRVLLLYSILEISNKISFFKPDALLPYSLLKHRSMQDAILRIIGLLWNRQIK